MLRSLASVLLFILLPWPVQGQVSLVKAAEPVALNVASLDEEEVRRRHRASGEELEALRAEIEAKEAPSPFLEQRLAFLEQIDLLHQQELNALDRQLELKHSLDDLESQRDELRLATRTSDSRATIVDLDRLHDELERLGQRLDRAAIASESNEASLIEARDVLEGHESQRRVLEEEAEASTDASIRLELGRSLERLSLEARRAQESLFLLKMEVANDDLLERLLGEEQSFLEEQIATIAPEARMRADDLDEIVARMEQEKADVDQRIDSTRLNLELREEKWLEARGRFEEAFSPAEGSLAEEVEFWRLARAVRQTEMALLSRHLERLASREELWVRRLRVATNSVDPLLLEEWLDAGEAALARYERDSELTEGRISELQDEIRALDDRLSRSEDLDADTLRWLREQPAQLRNLIAAYESDLAILEGLHQLESRLLEEVVSATGTISFDQRLKGLQKRLDRVWLYEIAKIDERPVTVKKLIIALALVFLGLLISRLISWLIGHRILPRVGIEKAGAAAMQSVLFYLFLIISTLFALNYAEVPLAWLTVLGGAVAIGVGFGSRNIVDNFLSGLLLLAERPVKVGDLIEIDEVFGNIAKIGPRSTRVVTGANLEIIVPNSTFVQTNVANWTHQQNLIRTNVKVGVAYGSPVETVRVLLERAATNHPDVRRSPAPFVWFMDFGDNALLFEVHFWVHVRSHAEWMTINSGVRFAIDRLFRAAGIVIAFPQRDLHLHTERPIPVRMFDDEDVETPRQKAESFLRRHHLFTGLEALEIESLVQTLEEHSILAGESVLRQGDEGASLLLVVSGLLSVSVEADGVEREVRELYPGDCFGEISLLTGTPRTASVKAMTQAIVYELSHEPLRPILQQRPETAELLSDRMARHLKGPDRFLEPKDSEDNEEPDGLAADILNGIRTFFSLG